MGTGENSKSESVEKTTATLERNFEIIGRAFIGRELHYLIRRRPDNFELWIDDFFMKLVEKLESSPHLIHQLMDSVSKRRCILLEKAIDILFKEELILSRKREVAR